MRFFRGIKKRLRIRSLLLAAVFGILIYMPLFGFSALRSLAPGGMGSSRTYQGIVSLWNVDTFEGGTYSREALLGDFARGFEQQNKGIFVVIQGFTPEEFEWQLEQGNRPDIISFGIGTGALLKDKLQKYGGKVFARDDINAGGKVGGKLYAVPWCMGGYALFSTEKLSKDAKTVTGSKYTLPLAAYIKNEITLPVLEGYSENTQYSAYENYIKKYDNCLLGSQRDIYRLGLKADQGKIATLTVRPLGGYTDLVQYMGIFENVDGTRLGSCEAFIEYVTGETGQRKIERLSMFSVSGVRLYGSGYLAEAEEILSRPLNVLNVFTAAHIMEEYKKLCGLAVNGDQAAKKTINGL